jgi:antitoxin (DNA-binding transcriptional repressor) of toxin-antitoxin stability system
MKIMETRITATELARNLSDILNRAYYQGEEFVVERGGQPMCRIAPPRVRGCTPEEFARLLKELPKPDDEYLDILEEITRNQPPVPESPWSR